MHPYSTDSNERERVLLGLAVLAIVLALGLSKLLQATHFIVPWWVDAPSTMGLYGILFKCFDKSLWRWVSIRWTRLLKVPVLAGEWHGHVLSSFDDHKKPHEVTVRINQTWTRIMVLLSSATSDSHTRTASIEVDAPEGAVLTYQYENQPKPGAVRTMEMHIGTAGWSSLTVGFWRATITPGVDAENTVQSILSEPTPRLSLCPPTP